MFDNFFIIVLHMDNNMIQAIEHIPGGLAKDKKPEEFDPKALAKGIDIEMEHTDDPNVAREISMDHLTESPVYYDELEKMEKKIEKQANQLAARFIREIMAGDSEKRLAHRSQAKKAATINTETASIYVLAGEHLEKLIEAGEFNSAVHDGDYNRADRVILAAGGLVFHTGSDGSYEVDVKPS